ncbi:MAG: methyltransferase domain-containing protein [Pigmentiphaga sp.]|uniref:class I SAM-dependent methyltransferase n=1 Tax=Pigmentiphaga sp. TaxID=1977564 RepID=UPI0029BABE30|nr:methyltransferase domain-containing protein [Pigmentiphaga sp.]MDX3904713.1 methyltransferase domain-containing protein [Pigmentiphaga sp.]
MLPSDAQDTPIVELAAWLATDPGRYALAWEQARLDEAVSDVFGFYAMQGGLPQLDALRANRMAFKGYVAESLPAEGLRPNWNAFVVADLEALPFDAQSLDLLVLPHTLECSSDPHRLLREAERVLIPEGRLVITGFNPWSLWGAGRMLGRREPFLPAGIQPLSPARLKDWLKLLSFEVESGRFGAYVPPCRTDKWLRRHAFMERAGERWWPVCGGVYIVSAIKRTVGLRLIVPPWKKRKASRRRAAVAAASREAHSLRAARAWLRWRR